MEGGAFEPRLGGPENARLHGEGDQEATKLAVHDEDTRLSDWMRISRSTSVPVTLPRWPTWTGRFHRRLASTMSLRDDVRLRNPDFQLRAFGTSAPAVFFSWNAPSPCSRHPVIVIG